VAKRETRQQDVQVEPPRRNYAARGIAGLLAPVVRPAFRKRAPAAAQLLADWDSLAGPDFANRAAPVKFAGGTLTLACTGPVAMELQHAAPALIARLNLALGHNTVERLRFVAQAPLAAPAAQAVAIQRNIAPPEGLPDDELGAALAKLYNGMRSRRGP